jgi:hypothetical protein
VEEIRDESHVSVPERSRHVCSSNKKSTVFFMAVHLHGGKKKVGDMNEKRQTQNKMVAVPKPFENRGIHYCALSHWRE